MVRQSSFNPRARHALLPEQPLKVVRISEQRAGRPHAHGFYELVLILKGSGAHVTKAGKWPLGAGDVFIIEPGYEHYYDDVDQLQLINVLIYPIEEWFHAYDLINEPGWHAIFTLEPRLRAQHNFRSRLQLKDRDLQRCIDILESMEEEQEQQCAGWHHALVTRFGLLVEALVRARQSARSGERSELIRLAEVLAAIESTVDQEWNVERLCTMLDCSPSTLQRSFNKAVGMPPRDWILQRRIQHACYLLRHSDNSITSIAFDCGFEDSNYFTRQFKKSLGVSPRDWRKRLL